MQGQNLNNPLSQRSEILNTGGFVGSPFTGAVNFAVLLFDSPGVVTGPPSYITEVNDADDGTTVTLNKEGLYLVQLHVEEAGAQASTLGISQDVDPSGLAARPAFTIPGMLDVINVLTAAVTAVPMNITTRVFAQAGSVIRFHATTSGGAAPALDFNQNTPYYRITRINQAYG